MPVSQRSRHTYIHIYIHTTTPQTQTSEYFGGLDDGAIKDNFSTVYQLLEEMMDNGYPLTTEPNALKVRWGLETVLASTDRRPTADP